jgi:hypothetical protein
VLSLVLVVLAVTHGPQTVRNLALEQEDQPLHFLVLELLQLVLLAVAVVVGMVMVLNQQDRSQVKKLKKAVLAVLAVGLVLTILITKLVQRSRAVELVIQVLEIMEETQQQVGGLEEAAEVLVVSGEIVQEEQLVVMAGLVANTH